MSRPPLANLLAVHDEDPHALDLMERWLRSGGPFTDVWRPVEGWVVAAAPLPDSEPDSPSVRINGLAFAEGRDVVAPNAAGDGRQVFAGIAQLVDERPDRLASLPGDFGFIRFRAHGEATVVRSCGGLVPFYLRHQGSRTIISTRLTDLVRCLTDGAEFDPLVLGVWTTGYGFFPDGRTFFRDVSIVPRGTFATIRRDRSLNTAAYWRPRPERMAFPTPAVQKERAARLRTLLLETLGRDLDPDGGNLLTFSGGVDSSSLVALAALALGRKVDTWSMVPTDADVREKQMAYIRPLWEACGVGRRWVVPLESATRIALLGQAPKVAFPIVHPALGALPDIIGRAPVRVLCGGEFADELCGSVFTVPDWCDHTSVFRLLAGVWEGRASHREVRYWLGHRYRLLRGRPMMPFPASLPAYVRQGVREEYREWVDRRRRAVVHDRGTKWYFALRAELDGFVAMNWEATSTLSVRRSFPFFTRDALELAFQAHPAELVGPGTKRLLRRALENDVPSHSLNRPDKGRWPAPTTPVVWSRELPEPLGCLFEPEWDPCIMGTLSDWTVFVLALVSKLADDVAWCVRTSPLSG